MTTPHDQIAEDLRTALKAGDRERVSTLRMLLNEINNEKIRQQEEVDEQGFAKLTRRAVKQREEAAEQYDEGGRAELAAKERREAELLSAYLPEEVDETELRAAIREILEASGEEGPRAMGVVMREMMSRFGGRADGRQINQLVREQLSGD